MSNRRKQINLKPINDRTISTLVAGNKYKARLSENADHSVGKWVEVTWDGRFFQRAMAAYTAQYRVDEVSEVENVSQKLVNAFPHALAYMTPEQLAALAAAIEGENRKRTERYVGRQY